MLTKYDNMHSLGLHLSTRTQRLFDLLQILRKHRNAVSGKQLATELGVSLRTLYRDIVTLQGQGANIEGEPGLGYLLKPGFMLPPLMFSEEEIEALVLGSRWVARRGDGTLKMAATHALAKISAVLPSDLRHQLESSGLLIGSNRDTTPINDAEETLIRQAIRKEYKLQLIYTDLNNDQSQRIIWPLALGFFEHARVIVAWCELRQDFRHFRTDRIIQIIDLDLPYPRRRQNLLKKWREINNIPDQPL